MSEQVLEKQDAAAVVLELMVRQTARLFDERFDDDQSITPANLAMLRAARDTQLQRLNENLKFARQQQRK